MYGWLRDFPEESLGDVEEAKRQTCVTISYVHSSLLSVFYLSCCRFSNSETNVPIFCYKDQGNAK